MRTFSFSSLISISVLLAAISAPSVLASGSDALGGASTAASRLYNQGKGVYANKIGCDQCVLAGKELDKTIAMELVEGKGMGAKALMDLSADEKSALMTYLQRRFKL
jgi:hypothetical protein